MVTENFVAFGWVYAKPEHAEEYARLLAAYVAATVAEDGPEVFEISKGQDGASFFAYERWPTRKHFDDHIERRMRPFLAETERMMARPMDPPTLCTPLPSPLATSGAGERR